jgi:hypothetical protein
VSVYTQEFLDELITCPKTIAEPPKKSMTSLHGSKRNDMIVESGPGKRFRVFMRQSEAFEEDFSIGLRFEPPGGEAIVLMRCNGIHGDVQSSQGATYHAVYHIHKARAENIEQGLRPERGGEPTNEYATFDQALRYFLKATRIEWTDTHFPRLRQTELFTEGFDDTSFDD